MSDVEEFFGDDFKIIFAEVETTRVKASDWAVIFRRWEKRSKTKKQLAHLLRDMMSEKFIKRLAMDAAVAKTGLREMMRRSPNWSESLQAWVLPFEIELRVKPRAVHEMIRAMWQNRAGYFLPDGENDDCCDRVKL